MMKTNRDRVRSVLLAGIAAVVGLAATAGPTRAQPTLKTIIDRGSSLDEAGTATLAPSVPQDDLARGVPRTAVEAFLAAARKGDYERAAQYLDLRQLPKTEGWRSGPDLARALKVALDRGLWIDLDALSDAPEGHAKDGLPAYRDRVGKIELPDGRSIDILLQRVSREDGVQIWKVASATVMQIPALYDALGYGPLGEILPPVLFDIEFAGFRLWQWIALAAFLPLATLAAYLVTWPILLVLRIHAETTARLRPFVTGPVRLWIVVALIAAAKDPLRLGVEAQAFIDALRKGLVIAAVAWLLMRVVDSLGSRLMMRLTDVGRTALIPVLPTLGRVVKGVVVFVAGVQLLSGFGFNVTALVAGLGVGGIAVALAAQKTVENVIGGIALFANQPVRVGEFCAFGDKLGTVEEIGLYATRVRTLDRTVVTVPNAQFSTMQIENYTRRDRFWYNPRIGLRYETTPDQIRYVLVEIRKVLYAHPRVYADPARVRFVGFGAYSLDIDIFAYVHATDYTEFLEVAEDLNLRIMDIVSAAGSSFAFPSQTTYIESGEGLDRERAREAEERVRAWRERKELLLPRFPAETIAALDDTLAYPPAGSAVASGNARGPEDGARGQRS
jgi:MscS family membrane protein